MTIITDMQTKYPPDPLSPYQLLLDASRSKDPSFLLEILKDSIRNSQPQDGGEVKIGQIQEHLKMEGWVDAEKRDVEEVLWWYKSDERFSFKTKLAILYACITFGAICCQLVYNLYLGQELSVETRAVLIATTFGIPFFGTLLLTMDTHTQGNWNPLYNKDYNSINVSELKERQLELIDCYLNEVLPLKAEIPASRYRHDVLAMIYVGEWMFYAFFRFCYSIYHLSQNWSNEKIRGFDNLDIVISGFVFSGLSGVFIYFWNSSKLTKD
ncbi:hypothetical protein CRE_11252 [Caenorhabditis remanei]|uniref:Uncharacterized protein n=1 Tax=Caenorhabditis remanei TaxID=31234 RepID=E3MQ67_CAERE|nr:hypothetical protein CRE_11252 [Caenorhabditis remanei]